MSTRFLISETRYYQKTIGKRCMHCGRSATVKSAYRLASGFLVRVRYCETHAEMHIGRRTPS